MYAIINQNSNYQPHHEDVKIVNENNDICGVVAWWSDNPIKCAIAEAKHVVKLYKTYKIDVTRIVLHKGVEVFRV